jgi:ABC-type bacteriocin/lantibiotic exporter with double-glycine peptidase domain
MKTEQRLLKKMALSWFLFTNRLSPLLSLYDELLGWSNATRLLLSSACISFLQLLGLVLVFPFVKLVTETEFHQRIVLLFTGTPFVDLLLDQQRAILIFGVSLVSIVVMSSFLTERLIRYQLRMAAAINSDISDRLVRESLTSRYQLFLEHSPVKIGGISYSHTTHVSLLFQSVSAAFNEMILLGLVLLGVVSVSPWAALGLGVLVLFIGVGFSVRLSRRSAAIGRRTQEVDLARHRFVFTMTNAIRDIKIMGLEQVFIQRNYTLATHHANLTAEYSAISTVQRLAIEVILFCCVVVATIWFAWTGEDLKQAAPAIATLGLIAVRCAPALSRLAGAYNSFRYSLPIVEGLIDLRRQLGNFSQHRSIQAADFPGEYCATGLCFSYGDQEVLRDCSIRIAQGEVVAIVGPSGAGKSTLLDLLSGLQPPSAGHFTLAGIDFSPFHSISFPSRVGYVPQAIALLDDSMAFNIALEVNPDPSRLQRAIERASLVQLVNSLPRGLDTPLGEGGQGLSGGQRQRIGIARALYREPALLILDEVTSALDEATARAIMVELLTMRGQVSLLFVTHDLRLLVADRVYRLDHGRISLPGVHI